MFVQSPGQIPRINFGEKLSVSLEADSPPLLVSAVVAEELQKSRVIATLECISGDADLYFHTEPVVDARNFLLCSQTVGSKSLIVPLAQQQPASEKLYFAIVPFGGAVKCSLSLALQTAPSSSDEKEPALAVSGSTRECPNW